MAKDHRGRPIGDNYLEQWRDAHGHKCEHCGSPLGTGRNEVASTTADYTHWNEEAPIIKAQEDRYTDYYNDPNDYNDYDD